MHMHSELYINVAPCSLICALAIITFIEACGLIKETCKVFHCQKSSGCLLICKTCGLSSKDCQLYCDIIVRSGLYENYSGSTVLVQLVQVHLAGVNTLKSCIHYMSGIQHYSSNLVMGLR